MKNDQQDIVLKVDGMNCSGCANSITRVLEKKGMEQVNVDFAAGTAKFHWNKGVEMKEIISGIENLGYKVHQENTSNAIDHSYHHHVTSSFSLLAKVLFCAALTLPLLLNMILKLEWLSNPVVQLIFCSPVILIGFFQFGISSFKSIRARVPNMDVLIFIGSSAAFIYSVIGAFVLHNDNFLFFETASVIITLVLLGNYIEQISIQQTRTAVQELSSLQPQTAKQILFFGEVGKEIVTEVKADEIKINEYFLVNTGDKIPADGIVAWGNGTCDESMITGESLPAEKKLNNYVVGGTILSSGSIKIKSTAVGKDTTLSHIIELVNDANRTKAPVQKLADKLTAVFVPVVLGISAVTFILCFFVFKISFEKSLMNSIAVLVVSCPCAMGLATPTAVVVGTGRAARKGILFKGAATMEALSQVKTIVFDKTGTLTTGEFKIEKINVVGVSPLHTVEEIKTILISLEKFSSHPIAKSIVRELQTVSPIELQNIKEEKGISISGKDAAGNIFSAGSYSIASSITDDNTHSIYLLKNKELLATVDLKDEIKSGVKEMIAQLRAMNIKPIMLSGDTQKKCAAIAGEIGIEQFYASQKPDEKLQIIENLTRENKIAMVGDGINDAPALTKADVGISLSNATQVAIDSADIILLNGNPNSLIDALKISKHTHLTIRQNLFWAFFYNVLTIPVAAFGFLNPMIGAFSMAGSDVVVIGNSIRLKLKR